MKVVVRVKDPAPINFSGLIPWGFFAKKNVRNCDDCVWFVESANDHVSPQNEEFGEMIKNKCFCAAKFQIYQTWLESSKCDLCGEKINEGDICFRCTNERDYICTKCANWKVCVSRS